MDELYFHGISDQNAFLFFTAADNNLPALQAELHDLHHEICQHTRQDASVQIADAFQALFEKHTRRKKRKTAKP